MCKDVHMLLRWRRRRQKKNFRKFLATAPHATFLTPPLGQSGMKGPPPVNNFFITPKTSTLNKEGCVFVFSADVAVITNNYHNTTLALMFVPPFDLCSFFPHVTNISHVCIYIQNHNNHPFNQWTVWY